jgi:magnesium transporter
MSKATHLDNLDEPITRHARTDFVAIRADRTVKEVLDSIRTTAKGGTFVYFYVVDADHRLVGVLQTRRLLTAPLDSRADAIMTTNVIAIPDSFTVLDACEFFVLHRLLAFPVVDKDKRVLGVVDVGLFTQEMFDIEERERIHGLFETLGIRISDVQGKSAWSVFHNRFPWLMATIASGTICALLVGAFHVTLAKSLILAFFLTLVLGLGESVSMQVMGITVHSLHHQDTEGGWYWTTLVRELKRTFVLGLTCALIVGCIAILWKRDAASGVVIASGILASLLMACFLGVSIPVLLHRLRLDLRVACGPATLALTDVCTIVVYFSLAAVVLGE